MATTKSRSGRKSTGSRSAAASKSTGTKRKSSGAGKNNSGRRKNQQQPDLTPEILLFAIVLVLLVVSLCTFGVVQGPVGEGIRHIILGLFGAIGYLLPPVLILYVFFGNRLPDTLRFKVSSLLLVLIAGMLCALFGGNDLEALAALEEGQAKEFYEAGKGGGVFFGFPALWSYRLFGGKVLPILLLLLVAVFCILTIFRLSFFGTIRAVAEKLSSTAEEIREVPRRYAPDEEELEARRERKAARMRAYEEDRERNAQLREEEQVRREEAMRRRQERLLEEDEKRAEAARARQEREEAARAAFEEKKARREEERQRRKEAEEQAEDLRILNASRPAPRAKQAAAEPNYVSATLQERPYTSPDEMHEITLPRMAGTLKNAAGAVSGTLGMSGVEGAAALGTISPATEPSFAKIGNTTDPAGNVKPDRTTGQGEDRAFSGYRSVGTTDELRGSGSETDGRKAAYGSGSETDGREDAYGSGSDTDGRKAAYGSGSETDGQEAAHGSGELSDREGTQSEGSRGSVPVRVNGEHPSENVLLRNMPKPVTERSHTQAPDSAAAQDVTEQDTEGKRAQEEDSSTTLLNAGEKEDTASVSGGNENGSAAVSGGNENGSAAVSGVSAVGAGKTEEKEKKPVRAKKYERPPISLLNKNEKKKGGDSDQHLQETALLLVQTLQSFGVTAEVSGISQGPSVTRFELEPAPGTKVNKIVGLADDLKLGLAAQDIRIEAPIPGKSAVGIEIPNKETSAVCIRELIESEEFKNAESKISYAVGKDISGQVVVSDIAKMPHLLVAGATGSGKSVFINTLIMSILYEADPEEVKLIMVDPKFVELSVYNGIPHLLLPVVTDPRQANAALAWAVAEMTRRYRLFETNKVRGLPAYNEMVDAGTAQALGENEEVKRLPQIVVIVDELADLMMVASKEVEESICRLAQLARAAGIHLVIATQRPSVNVITGLIKANMPSRIAFKVSSGIDSRTILDMVGAERLLGYGDMLFSPQNLNKPLRVQGAFVSDSEVTKVVDFLKKNAGDDVYDEEIVSSINSKMSQEDDAEPAEKSSRGNSGSFDSMFDEVARYVVEKEKASSTMLQRVFKISYNRAVRIIDQLEENGVIGAEAGTKPRNVLMNMAQLEEFLQSKAGN